MQGLCAAYWGRTRGCTCLYLSAEERELLHGAKPVHRCSKGCDMSCHSGSAARHRQVGLNGGANGWAAECLGRRKEDAEISGHAVKGAGMNNKDAAICPYAEQNSGTIESPGRGPANARQSTAKQFQGASSQLTI